MDTDRDGNWELMFTTYGVMPRFIYIYELHLPNSWLVDSIPQPGANLLWDGGDFDVDGLYDLVLQFHFENPLADGIMVFESPDSFSFPTQEVWRDTVCPPQVLPISAYDIDQDDLPELVVNRAIPYGDIGIYEAIGADHYQLIFADDPDTLHYDAPAATHAFGDFDEDGNVECVFAGADDPYWIYECIGNNSYVKIAEGELPTGNIRDCFSVADADGDGKLEFVLKGYRVSNARIEAYVFEAVGDNTYEVIKNFDLAGGSVYYWGGLSDAGDVDGDSVPEILIEGCQTVYIVKAVGNDSFYVWETLPGHVDGSCVRVFDLDGNGLSEVIISGNNETRIYEYEVGVAENTPSEIWTIGLSVSSNPFRDQTIIKYFIQDPGHWMRSPTLRIYDVSGRLIRAFRLPPSSENQESSVTWYGDDDYGKVVPQGVY
ncbi:MAG: FG-GAP-like repeat-containing protein, partial [bacterium]